MWAGLSSPSHDDDGSSELTVLSVTDSDDDAEAEEDPAEAFKSMMAQLDQEAPTQDWEVGARERTAARLHDHWRKERGVVEVFVANPMVPTRLREGDLFVVSHRDEKTNELLAQMYLPCPPLDALGPLRRMKVQIPRYTPRMKVTNFTAEFLTRSAAASSTKPRRSGEIDIANMVFAELPLLWRKANLDAARDAVQTVERSYAIGALRLHDGADGEVPRWWVDYAAAEQHSSWCDSTPWAEAEASVPFPDLPPVLRDANRKIVLIAVQQYTTYCLSLYRSAQRSSMTSAVKDFTLREFMLALAQFACELRLLNLVDPTEDLMQLDIEKTQRVIQLSNVDDLEGEILSEEERREETNRHLVRDALLETRRAQIAQKARWIKDSQEREKKDAAAATFNLKNLLTRRDSTAGPAAVHPPAQASSSAPRTKGKAAAAGPLSKKRMWFDDPEGLSEFTATHSSSEEEVAYDLYNGVDEEEPSDSGDDDESGSDDADDHFFSASRYQWRQRRQRNRVDLRNLRTRRTVLGEFKVGDRVAAVFTRLPPLTVENIKREKGAQTDACLMCNGSCDCGDCHARSNTHVRLYKLQQREGGHCQECELPVGHDNAAYRTCYCCNGNWHADCIYDLEDDVETLAMWTCSECQWLGPLQPSDRRGAHKTASRRNQSWRSYNCHCCAQPFPNPCDCNRGKWFNATVIAKMHRTVPKRWLAVSQHDGEQHTLPKENVEAIKRATYQIEFCDLHALTKYANYETSRTAIRVAGWSMYAGCATCANEGIRCSCLHGEVGLSSVATVHGASTFLPTNLTTMSLHVKRIVGLLEGRLVEVVEARARVFHVGRIQYQDGNYRVTSDTGESARVFSPCTSIFRIRGDEGWRCGHCALKSWIERSIIATPIANCACCVFWKGPRAILGAVLAWEHTATARSLQTLCFEHDEGDNTLSSSEAQKKEARQRPLKWLETDPAACAAIEWEKMHPAAFMNAITFFCVGDEQERSMVGAYSASLLRALSSIIKCAMVLPDAYLNIFLTSAAETLEVLFRLHDLKLGKIISVRSESGMFIDLHNAPIMELYNVAWEDGTAMWKRLVRLLKYAQRLRKATSTLDTDSSEEELSLCRTLGTLRQQLLHRVVRLVVEDDDASTPAQTKLRTVVPWTLGAVVRCGPLDPAMKAGPGVCPSAVVGIVYYRQEIAGGGEHQVNFMEAPAFRVGPYIRAVDASGWDTFDRSGNPPWRQLRSVLMHGDIQVDEGLHFNTHMSVCSFGTSHIRKKETEVSVDEMEPAEDLALSGRTFRSISAGDRHSLAISSAGRAVYAWGESSCGQLGFRTSDVVEMTATVVPIPPLPATQLRIAQIATGSFHSVALTELGEVFSWGSGRFGRLGHGRQSDEPRPRAIRALHALRVQGICAGKFHTMCIVEDGNIYAWGRGDEGQLGVRLTAKSVFTVPRCVNFFRFLPRGERARYIFAGRRHTFAISASGFVYCWGRNVEGQLGLSYSSDAVMTPQVNFQLSGKHIIALACSNHTLALTINGRVLSFGKGDRFQLGRGEQGNRHDPMVIDRLLHTRIVHVAAALHHSVCLDHRGRVYTFGWNRSGQLGHGSTANKGFPTRIESAICSQAKQIVCSKWATRVLITPLRTQSRLRRGVIDRFQWLCISCSMKMTAEEPCRACGLLDEHRTLADSSSSGGLLDVVTGTSHGTRANKLSLARYVKKVNRWVARPLHITSARDSRQQLHGADKLGFQRHDSKRYGTTALHGTHVALHSYARLPYEFIDVDVLAGDGARIDEQPWWTIHRKLLSVGFAQLQKNHHFEPRLVFWVGCDESVDLKYTFAGASYDLGELLRSEFRRKEAEATQLLSKIGSLFASVVEAARRTGNARRTAMIRLIRDQNSVRHEMDGRVRVQLERSFFTGAPRHSLALFPQQAAIVGQTGSLPKDMKRSRADLAARKMLQGVQRLAEVVNNTFQSEVVRDAAKMVLRSHGVNSVSKVLHMHAAELKRINKDFHGILVRQVFEASLHSRDGMRSASSSSGIYSAERFKSLEIVRRRPDGVLEKIAVKPPYVPATSGYCGWLPVFELSELCAVKQSRWSSLNEGRGLFWKIDPAKIAVCEITPGSARNAQLKLSPTTCIVAPIMDRRNAAPTDNHDDSENNLRHIYGEARGGTWGLGATVAIIDKLSEIERKRTSRSMQSGYKGPFIFAILDTWTSYTAAESVGGVDGGSLGGEGGDGETDADVLAEEEERIGDFTLKTFDSTLTCDGYIVKPTMNVATEQWIRTSTPCKRSAHFSVPHCARRVHSLALDGGEFEALLCTECMSTRYIGSNPILERHVAPILESSAPRFEVKDAPSCIVCVDMDPPIPGAVFELMGSSGSYWCNVETLQKVVHEEKDPHWDAATIDRISIDYRPRRLLREHLTLFKVETADAMYSWVQTLRHLVKNLGCGAIADARSRGADMRLLHSNILKELPLSLTAPMNSAGYVKLGQNKSRLQPSGAMTASLQLLRIGDFSGKRSVIVWCKSSEANGHGWSLEIDDSGGVQQNGRGMAMIFRSDGHDVHAAFQLMPTNVRETGRKADSAEDDDYYLHEEGTNVRTVVASTWVTEWNMAAEFERQWFRKDTARKQKRSFKRVTGKIKMLRVKSTAVGSQREGAAAQSEEEVAIALRAKETIKLKLAGEGGEQTKMSLAARIFRCFSSRSHEEEADAVVFDGGDEVEDATEERVIARQIIEAQERRSQEIAEERYQRQIRRDDARFRRTIYNDLGIFFPDTEFINIAIVRTENGRVRLYRDGIRLRCLYSSYTRNRTPPFAETVTGTDTPKYVGIARIQRQQQRGAFRAGGPTQQAVAPLYDARMAGRAFRGGRAPVFANSWPKLELQDLSANAEFCHHCKCEVKDLRVYARALNGAQIGAISQLTAEEVTGHQAVSDCGLYTFPAHFVSRSSLFSLRE